MTADGAVLAALWSAVGVFAVATAVLAVALGRTKRSHRAIIEQHGWILERERATVAETAVQAERARIAAELHDIVGHNVSVIVIQAGVARDALERDPAEVRSALHNVEQAGR